MNAVIALCHFCEAHGPCAIFCTQTLRDTKVEDLILDKQQPKIACPSCNSTGLSTVLASRDVESNASFVSTQIPVFPEVATMVKQASVRSLSCEISCNKDGGFVFFGDSSRGHVLSYTFNVSDVQARGFYQLFSIIILMKDKYFLLNIQPFLSEGLQKISKELQRYAQKLYDEEQLTESARERRLSNNQTLPQIPRSLIELTAEKNIFAILHSHFTWILLAGSRFLTEHVIFDDLPWLSSKVNKHPPNICETNSLNNEIIWLETEGHSQNFNSLRHVRDLLGADFIPACYCTLIGIKIIIRGPIERCNAMAMCLKSLLPNEMHKNIKFNSSNELSDPRIKIITVPSEVAVPLPSSSIFRIDLLDNTDNNVSVRWNGELPIKSPNLLQKIVKATDEALFTDLVLDKHLNALKEEWKKYGINKNKSDKRNH